jgi:CRISPR/Cas system CMR-associated protein Cmr1 (group 7 of RAMP superfamily)
LITLDKLASEIEKLSRYEASDLKDLETTLFGASKKGFDTVAKGTEKPLVISERSNQRKVAQELKDSIQSLFTLNKSNELAQDDPNFELKNNNVRFK